MSNLKNKIYANKVDHINVQYWQVLPSYIYKTKFIRSQIISDIYRLIA